MDEYISREETVKKIEEKLKVDGLMSLAEEVWTDNCLKIVLRAIMAVETADVQPVVYAHKTINVGRRSYCSNCGKLAIMEDFCSKCGAKVKDDEQNDD